MSTSRSRKTRVATTAAVAAGALLPAALAAPRSSGDGLSLDAAERLCRDSGLAGWQLVDFAAQLVSEQFQAHSLWHLWENPATAMRNRRGWAGQYNLALEALLRRLGFDTLLVHASRVRGLGANPWWQAGHTWVRVAIDGRMRDVTAARGRDGGLATVTAVTEVRPVHVWTLPSVTAMLAPISAYQAWKHRVTREPVPTWMYRRLDLTDD